MKGKIMIRDARTEDAQRIAEIYNPYILNTVITFEEIPVGADEIAKRIENVNLKGLPWIVSEIDDRIIGYAYASLWRTRAAYRYTVETTVYIDQNYRGKGYGKQLYSALIERLRQSDIHTAIAVIALPNDESVGLHEGLGFKKVAQFHEVGFKFDRWIDDGFWELLL